MDITILAAWGEFLGGIGVIASLIYLASQIRQNSKLLRNSTSSASSSVQNDATSLLVQDADVARIYDAGIVDRDSLSDVDRRRFDSVVTMWVNGWNQEFGFSVDGVIAPSVWETREQIMRMMLQYAGMRQWWLEWRGFYGAEFSHFIDSLIREGEAAE